MARKEIKICRTSQDRPLHEQESRNNINRAQKKNDRGSLREQWGSETNRLRRGEYAGKPYGKKKDEVPDGHLPQSTKAFNEKRNINKKRPDFDGSVKVVRTSSH